jgi:hypothetical protein
VTTCAKCLPGKLNEDPAPAVFIENCSHKKLPGSKQNSSLPEGKQNRDPVKIIPFAQIP